MPQELKRSAVKQFVTSQWRLQNYRFLRGPNRELESHEETIIDEIVEDSVKFIQSQLYVKIIP